MFTISRYKSNCWFYSTFKGPEPSLAFSSSYKIFDCSPDFWVDGELKGTSLSLSSGVNCNVWGRKKREAHKGNWKYTLSATHIWDLEKNLRNFKNTPQK
jgi:hypothetical protein